MRVTLDEVVAGVELPEGSVRFAIRNPKPLKFIMEPEVSRSLPQRLVPKYSKVQLAATDILAANDDARSRLRPLGNLLPTYFWFNQGPENDRNSISVVDRDPSRHRVIYVGGDLPHAGSQKATAFSDAVAASKYVEKKPYWDSGALYIRLKPEFVRPTQRLATYIALVELL